MQTPHDLIEELFGEQIQIEPTDVDNDQQYQKHLTPIYARLCSIEIATGMSVADEAVISMNEAQKTDYLCL
jgi:hypothetical protein